MPDSGKIRTLGNLLFKLETRSNDGSKRKLFMLFISFLLPGLFLPFLLYKQNPDPTGFQFAFLTYVFFSLVLSFAVISEFDNLIMSKTEIDIFTALPVDDEIIVSAKMYGIIRYIFIMSLPLLLPSGVYYYLILRSFPRAVIFFISGFFLCLFVINILLFIYSIALRKLKTNRLGIYTLVLQVLLIFALILGYQFVSYIFTGRPGSAISNHLYNIQKNGLIDYFPQAWFAFLPATHRNAVFDISIILKTILPVVVCFLSYLTLKYYLLENYSLIREKIIYSRGFKGENPSKKKIFLFELAGKIIGRIYIRDHSEQSSYTLMRNLFKRDKAVRLNILPMIVIPCGLALFAYITNQLPVPFSSNYFNTKPVFHISILLSVLVVLNTGILGLKVTSYTGVSWIYDAYPVYPKNRFINGIRKFYNLYLLVPVCFILFLFFAFKMPFVFALIHTLYIFVSANLFNTLYHIFNRTLPFTKDNTIFNSVSRLTSIFFPLLFGIIFIVLQNFVYKDLAITILTVGIILTVTFWLNYFGFIRNRD
ncbi:MAG: hypothetical protein EHM58_19110 [Ignavibacteriae bacterium]|nr:MAG: hypothetical protein EHM58_19110 [Ignavibacteriota bacterium]